MGAATALVAGAPSGLWAADIALSVAFGAVVTHAAGRARRWAWLVAAGVAAAATQPGWARWVAVLALGVALLAVVGDWRERLAGSFVGGCCVVALVGGVDAGPHGASALLTAVAVAPLLASGYQQSRRSVRRRARQIAFGAAVGIGMVAVAYGVAAASARIPVERGIGQMEAAFAAGKTGDVDRAAGRLDAAAGSFSNAHATLGAWWAKPALAVPVLGHQARMLEEVTGRAAGLASVAARSAVETDLDRLETRNGRVDLAAVRAMQSPLAGVRDALGATLQSIDEAESPWIAPPLRARVATLQASVESGYADARLAADAVDVLPALLGANETRRYFVAIVTPVEARGRTGFLGNFAELTATAGKLDMPRFGRNADLRDGGDPLSRRTISGPADYLARYGRFQPQSTWQNVNLSPDLPTVARVIAELYPQSGGRDIDGVLTVDTFALTALLEFTGPVTIAGVAAPLTSANAGNFLLRDQYIDFPDSPTRADALETLSREVFTRLTSGALPGPRRLAEVMAPLVRGGHLQFASLHRREQPFLARIGIDGAMPPVDGDFLSVVTSNASGSKIELFLRRSTRYAARVDPDTGAVEATIEVTLHNGAPAVGLPDYLIGNVVGQTALGGKDLPPGTSRLFLSVYTPWDLVAGEVDGTERDFEQQRELNRSVVSTMIDIPPGATRVVTLHVQGVLPARHRYRLDAVPQPLVEPEQIDLQVEQRGGAVRRTWVMDRPRRLELR